MRMFGLVLLVLGALGVAYGGFRYAYPDQVVNTGALQVSVTKHKRVVIPPLVGVVAIVAGAGLLAVGGRRSAA